jgi:hypothetical protein
MLLTKVGRVLFLNSPPTPPLTSTNSPSSQVMCHWFTYSLPSTLISTSVAALVSPPSIIGTISNVWLWDVMNSVLGQHTTLHVTLPLLLMLSRIASMSKAHTGAGSVTKGCSSPVNVKCLIIYSPKTTTSTTTATRVKTATKST